MSGGIGRINFKAETERRTCNNFTSDAGKTITEKLLLYGGAIGLAGAVKARKSGSYAVSVWMEIEKQRYISYQQRHAV